MAKVIPTQEVEDIEDLEEMDTMELELAEATAPAKAAKTPKAPKEIKPPKEPRISTTQIGSAGLAEMLGTTAFKLRGFLRKYFRDMASQKGQTYVWEKGSPELQAIVDAYNTAKSAVRAPTVKKGKKTAETAEITPTPEAPQIGLDDMDLDNME